MITHLTHEDNEMIPTIEQAQSCIDGGMGQAIWDHEYYQVTDIVTGSDDNGDWFRIVIGNVDENELETDPPIYYDNKKHEYRVGTGTYDHMMFAVEAAMYWV